MIFGNILPIFTYISSWNYQGPVLSFQSLFPSIDVYCT
uniref:Uncharacterized protein n=1 Tax=Arundo donax TaxID=35708 RepID=A0A0A9A0V6_ARUDO